MPKDIFDKTNKALAKKLDRKRLDQPQFNRLEQDRNTLLKAVGTDLAKLIGPALSDATERILKGILSKQVINVEPAKVTVPTPIVNVSSPDVHVPTPIANVTVPEIKIPEINIPQMVWPTGDMPIKGSVSLDGINSGNPLSVQLRDSKGKPVDFSQGSNSIMGGGGGIAKQVKINNTSDNPVPITGSIIVAAEATSNVILVNTDQTAYDSDNPLPVVVGGAASTSAVNLVDSTGVVFAGDNPLPVDTELPAAAALTDNMANPTTPLVGSALMVWDGAAWDRLGGSGATGIKVDIAVDSTAGLATSALQLPDDHNVTVTGVDSSVATALTDSTGEQYSGSNPVPVDLVDVSSLATSANQLADGHNVTVDNAAAGAAVNIQDGGNSITVDSLTFATSAKQLANGHDVTIDNISTNEVYVRGSQSAGSPVDGEVVTVQGIAGADAIAVTESSPISGFATSANQLADGHNVTIDNASGGSAVNIQDGGNTITVDGTVVVSSVTASTKATIIDSTGVGYSGSNPLPTRVVSTRGNLKTAYVTEDEIEEVTILAGVASEYHDLIMVMGANESDAAINVDLRATKGGTVMSTLAIPANGTAGVAFNNDAYPQQDIDASWTAKNNAADNSNTVYSITGLFKKVV